MEERMKERNKQTSKQVGGSKVANTDACGNKND